MLVLYIKTLQYIFTGKPTFIRAARGEKIGSDNLTCDDVTSVTFSTTSPQSSMCRTANLSNILGLSSAQKTSTHN